MKLLCFFSANKKSRVKKKITLYSVLFFLFVPALSSAGNFSVSPIRLNFDDGTKTGVVRVTNKGDESVTVQLNTKKWTQNESGADEYTETTDIVYFPKIVTIGREEERIIRVGYKGKTNVVSEKTYRLYLEELPVIKPGEMALKFALTIGLPIFISPAKEIKKTSLEKLAFSEGVLSVKVRNDGNRYINVGDITASGLDGKGREVFKTTGEGWYILAGSAKGFNVDIPEQDCQKAHKLDVTVEIEQSLLRGDLVLDKTQCAGNRQ